MPYANNAELPPAVREHLPWDAQSIFRESFNRAFAQHHSDDSIPFRIAWTAVKRQYDKVDHDWVPRWMLPSRG